MPSTKQSTMVTRAENKNKRLKRAANDPDNDSDGFESLGEEDTEYETDTSDSSYVPPTKKNKQQKRSKLQQKKGKVCDDDNDDDDGDDEDESFDVAKLQKVLARMFPSKYMSKEQRPLPLKRSELLKKSQIKRQIRLHKIS